MSADVDLDIVTVPELSRLSPRHHARRQQVSIMSSFLKTILFAFAAIAVATPVVAAETRVVPANRASAIFFFYSYATDTCYTGGKQTMHVTHEPSHGSVTAFWKAFKVGKDGPKNCTGMPVHGMLVIYKPKPGYHGSDKVSFMFTDPQMSGYIYNAQGYTVNITVK